MATKAIDFIIRVSGNEKLAKALMQARDQFLEVASAEDSASISANELQKSLDKLSAAWINATNAASNNIKTDADARRAALLMAAAAREVEVATAAADHQMSIYNADAIKNAMVMKEAADAQFAYKTELGKTYGALNTISKAGNPAFMKVAGWAGVDAVGVAYESVKKFMSFNSKLTQSVTQAGVPLKNMSQISAGILDISRQTGQSANDLADAFYRVASATAGSKTSVKDMLTYTKAIAQFNILGNIPQGVQSENSARVVMAAVNAQLRGTRGTGKAAVDKIVASLNAIIGTGDIRASDLLAGFGRGYLAVGKANNLSMADMGAAIDTLTQLGTGGAAAGTMAQRAIQMMFSPTTQGAKGLAMVGLQYDSLRKAETSGGLPAALKMLSDHLKKFDVFNYPKYKGASGRQGAINQLEEWFQGQLPQKFIDQWSKGMASKGGLSDADQRQIMTMMLSKMYGGSRSSATMMNLLFDLPRLTANYQNIQAHSTQAYLKKQEAVAGQSPAVQFRKIVANINADLIQLGKTLTPLALKIAHGFGGLVNAITKFKPLLYTLIAAVGGLATAYVAIKAAQFGKGVFGMFGSIGRGVEGASLWKKGIRGADRMAALHASDTAADRGVFRAVWAGKNAGKINGDQETLEMMRLLNLNTEALQTNSRALVESSGTTKSASRSSKLGSIESSLSGSGGKAKNIESAVGKVASEGGSLLSTGGGLLSSLAGPLSGVLDFMSGPVGMGLMMSMPLITAGVSSLFSWLNSGKSPQQSITRLTSVSSYNHNNSALNNKLKNAAKKLGSGNATSVLGFLGVLGKSKDLQTRYSHSYQEAAFLKAFDKMTGKGINPEAYGFDPLIALEKKQRKYLLNYVKNNPEVAKYLSTNASTALQYAELMGTTPGQIDSKNKRLRDLTIKNTLNDNQKQVDKYFHAMNNRKLAGGAATRYLAGVMGSQELAKKLGNEEGLLKTKGLTKGETAQLDSGIKKLKEEIKTMRSEAGRIAKNNGLDQQTIKSLAIEIANQNKVVYTSLGIGKDAFVAGIIAAAPTIASAIKNGNASIGSNQSPGTIATNN